MTSKSIISTALATYALVAFERDVLFNAEHPGHSNAWAFANALVKYESENRLIRESDVDPEWWPLILACRAEYAYRWLEVQPHPCPTEQ